MSWMLNSWLRKPKFLIRTRQIIKGNGSFENFKGLEKSIGCFYSHAYYNYTKFFMQVRTRGQKSTFLNKNLKTGVTINFAKIKTKNIARVETIFMWTFWHQHPIKKFLHSRVWHHARHVWQQSPTTLDIMLQKATRKIFFSEKKTRLHPSSEHHHPQQEFKKPHVPTSADYNGARFEHQRNKWSRETGDQKTQLKILVLKKSQNSKFWRMTVRAGEVQSCRR